MDQREQLGRYSLIQREGCFKLGSDSLHLSRFATLRPKWKVCDLGCGSGVLGLLLLEREVSLQVTGIELDPAAAQLARENFTLNQLSAQVIEGDFRDKSLLPAGQFDLVISNPPYFAQGSGKSGGAFRMEETCTLDQLCAIASRLLRNGGRFALVHRPERLAELMVALTAHHIEPKRLQLVQHSHSKAPSAVLVEGVRQGKPGLEVLATLVG